MVYQPGFLARLLSLVARATRRCGFHAPTILDYAPGNQQCMAGVRVEYTVNFKNLFSKWRP